MDNLKVVYKYDFDTFGRIHSYRKILGRERYGYNPNCIYFKDEGKYKYLDLSDHDSGLFKYFIDLFIKHNGVIFIIARKECKNGGEVEYVNPMNIFVKKDDLPIAYEIYDAVQNIHLSSIVPMVIGTIEIEKTE